MRNTATTDNAVQKHYPILDVKRMFLDCVIGRRGIANTASSSSLAKTILLTSIFFSSGPGLEIVTAWW
jgi:hypothetical protein